MCLAWSSVKKFLSRVSKDFGFPPIFAFKGKNLVGSFLHFISLNVLTLVLSYKIYFVKGIVCVHS